VRLSISHSDMSAKQHEKGLPKGLRLTASDRPGQAQPVPVRDVPKRPWIRLGSAAGCLMALMLGAWEWNARTNIGLRAGDLGDSAEAWAEQRALASTAPVVIIGDSRMLYDTDLGRFEQLTGTRPVQTSIIASSARGLLEDFANDAQFKGLLIVGLADYSYFRERGIGLARGYINGFDENQLPSQRTGLWIDRFLQRHFAFLDWQYRLSRLVTLLDSGLRKGANPSVVDTWKLAETFDHRQHFLWDRIERDVFLRSHALSVWRGFNRTPVSPQAVPNGIERSARAVRRIVARGGQVIFIRPPSAPELRIKEEQRIPKAVGWDALLRATKSKGIHADELTQAQDLVLPDWSHLTRDCARVFTDAYVRRIAELTPRLQLRAGAPEPLSRQDCVDPTRIIPHFSLYRHLSGDRAAAAHFSEARKVRAPRNNGAG
jgi:hypothetical protein